MFGEKVARDACGRCFVGDGLHAVLAKLRDVTVFIRTRPRATLAVEAIDLVDLEQKLCAAQKAYFVRRDREAFLKRPQSGGGLWSGFEARAFSLDRRLGVGKFHEAARAGMSARSRVA